MADGTAATPAGDSVGLTIKEYLARIDAKVDRIDEKLDMKADLNVVTSLESRIRNLEVIGSTHAQTALNEVEHLKAEHKLEIEQLWRDVTWLKKKVWIAAGAAGAIGGAWTIIHAGIIRLG